MLLRNLIIKRSADPRARQQYLEGAMSVTGAAFRQAHQGLDDCQGLSASVRTSLVEGHSVNSAEYGLLRRELHDKATVHFT